ncbi:MAG: hypothetical protein ABS46_10195 [Cytophagaceae bacterium SCN 52-12]|nr:MAG: hypothetical protein ABS46_10195 [Cytophagaceae bacterium SCN 52-12]
MGRRELTRNGSAVPDKNSGNLEIIKREGVILNNFKFYRGVMQNPYSDFDLTGSFDTSDWIRSIADCEGCLLKKCCKSYKKKGKRCKKCPKK